MSSNRPSSFVVTDQDGNRVSAPGKVRWEVQGRLILEDPPYKWELYIPHLSRGTRGETYELGGLSTGIEVYKSGYVSWPGKDIPIFPSHVEAKAFVEATFALEHPEEVG